MILGFDGSQVFLGLVGIDQSEWHFLGHDHYYGHIAEAGQEFRNGYNGA
jgi:hypothetical protein